MTRKILGCILAMAMLFACGSFSLAEGEGTPTIKMTAVLHPNTQNPGGTSDISANIGKDRR